MSDLDRICERPSNEFLQDIYGTIAQYRFRGMRPLILLALLERYDAIHGLPRESQ